MEGVLDNWAAELEGMVAARKVLEGHMLMEVEQVDMGPDHIGRIGDLDVAEPAAGEDSLHSHGAEDELEDHSQ